MLMRDEERRKKEASKAIQTRQSNTAHPRQSLVLPAIPPLDDSKAPQLERTSHVEEHEGRSQVIVNDPVRVQIAQSLQQHAAVVPQCLGEGERRSCDGLMC